MFVHPLTLGHLPTQLIKQTFAIPLNPEDLPLVTPPMTPREYFTAWRANMVPRKIVGSTIKSDEGKFQVNLDVQKFTPEEVTVKTADGYILIECKHEERSDEHGFVSRQFTRRYKLPSNCDPATVRSTLSSDGILMVVAPKIDSSANNERIVPITQTGPVRKVVMEQGGQLETKDVENGPEADGA